MNYRFPDRSAAGQLLAGHLRQYACREDAMVLALPRGGVPVAYEIARALDAPLDVLVVRKLGVPGHEELALGAIAADVRVVNEEIARELAISREVIDTIAEREQAELAHRERSYRGDRPPADIAGRAVILVDDGLATGATMHAAVAYTRQRSPSQIVIAVPVVALENCEAFEMAVDDIVWLIAPEPFYSVGLWYENFAPPTNAEIRRMLSWRPERKTGHALAAQI